jgi:hypothetical protein
MRFVLPQARFGSRIDKANSDASRESKFDPKSATLKMDSTVLKSKPELVNIGQKQTG